MESWMASEGDIPATRSCSDNIASLSFFNFSFCFLLYFFHYVFFCSLGSVWFSLFVCRFISFLDAGFSRKAVHGGKG